MTDAKTLSDLLRAPAAEAHELAFIAGPQLMSKAGISLGVTCRGCPAPTFARPL